MYQQLINSLSKESKILLNEPMKNHTSFKIGGPADILIIPASIEDIKKVISLAFLFIIQQTPNSFSPLFQTAENKMERKTLGVPVVKG